MVETNHWRHSRLTAVALGGGLLLGVSCSLLVDSRVTDCTTVSECPQGEAFVCRRQTGATVGRCIHLDGVSCEVNADCLVDKTICRTPTDGGTTGQCVGLLSQDCDTVVGDWANDDAFLVGSVLPTRDDNFSSGLACQHGIEMAIKEFSSGLPPAPGAGSTKRRPIALVGCNDNSDQIQGQRAAQHLVDLGIPAIIGAQWSGVTRAINNGVTMPNDVLLISPSATASSLTTLTDRGLLWRTSPSDVFQASALISYIPLVEDRVRAGDSARKVKLMLVYQGTDYGQGLSRQIAGELKLNGVSVLESPYYRGFDYGDKSAGNPYNTAGATEAILAFAPDIVVNLCTSEGVDDIFVPVERGWDARHHGVPGPRWIFGDGGKIGQLWGAVGANNELRQRVTGSVPGSNKGPFTQFVSTYKNQNFNDGTDPTALGPAGSYDALYLLAYSAVSLGAQPLTGPNLARGIAALVDGGVGVDVGDVTAINGTFQLLQAGQHINLNGASGPLDFDLSTGEAPSDIQIWCLRRALDGKADNGVNSGIYLDATTKKLQGTTYGSDCSFDGG